MRAHTRARVSQPPCDFHSFIHDGTRVFVVVSYLRLGRQQQSARKLVMEMRFFHGARHTNFCLNRHADEWFFLAFLVAPSIKNLSPFIRVFKCRISSNFANSCVRNVCCRLGLQEHTQLHKQEDYYVCMLVLVTRVPIVFQRCNGRTAKKKTKMDAKITQHKKNRSGGSTSSISRSMSTHR